MLHILVQGHILVHILKKRSYSLIFRPRLTNNGKDPITQKGKVLQLKENEERVQKYGEKYV